MCLGLFSSSSVSFIFLVMEGRGGGWWWWWYTSHNSRQIDNESLSDDRGNIGAMTYWRTKHRHTYIHTKRKQTRENLSDCGKIMAMEYTHNSTRLKRTNERTNVWWGNNLTCSDRLNQWNGNYSDSKDGWFQGTNSLPPTWDTFVCCIGQKRQCSFVHRFGLNMAKSTIQCLRHVSSNVLLINDRWETTHDAKTNWMWCLKHIHTLIWT